MTLAVTALNAPAAEAAAAAAAVLFRLAWLRLDGFRWLERRPELRDLLFWPSESIEAFISRGLGVLKMFRLALGPNWRLKKNESLLKLNHFHLIKIL